MAVRITATPIFDHGAPVLAVAVNASTFVVAPDGRFLVAIPTPETHVSPPITVHIKRTAAFKG